MIYLVVEHIVNRDCSVDVWSSKFVVKFTAASVVNRLLLFV